MAEQYGNVTIVQVTIAINQSLSAEVDLLGRTPVKITLPGAWDAANLTFVDAPVGGGTFSNVYDAAGTEYLVTAAAARSIPLDPLVFLGATALKIRSGTSALPVVQTAQRVLTLHLAALQ